MQAFAAGFYVAADGSSAAELYRDALKLDAGDARAKSGFERSIDLGLRGAEQALVENRLDAAAGAAETLRLLAPSNSRLAFLKGQIDKELSPRQCRCLAARGIRGASGADPPQSR